MFNSEECILDFKAEEKRTHITTFDVEGNDSNSTISASEVDSNGCSSPTPPLFYKLRKARVMVKRLPREVLAKYNLDSSISSLPARASKRIGGKQTPGLYLSLHVNKPLTEIVNKKKRLKPNVIKTVKQHTKENPKKFYQKQYEEFSRRYTKISVRNSGYKLSGKSYNTANISEVKKNPKMKCPLPNGQHVADKKIKLKKQTNVKKLLITPTSLPNTLGKESNKQSSSAVCRSLHERIASTRLLNDNIRLNNPVSSTLPNFPDVIITKYDVPSNSFARARPHSSTLSLSNSVNPFLTNKRVNIPSHVSSSIGNSYIQNAIMVSKPKQTFSNYARPQYTQSSNVFPTIITPALGQHKNTCLPIVYKSIASDKSNSSERTFTVQTFTMPHLPPKKDPVIASYPKVMIINKPSLKTDPLNISSCSAKNENSVEKPQKNTDNNVEPFANSETELDLSDNEKRTEPEVIKRIIYHTKSVQTKFTCNSSICGLVDSNGLNLNCFYCYDIFPLHKWFEFKEHIECIHHVQEKQNQSDLDEEINNTKSQNYCPIDTLQESSTKSISKKDITLNKETKAANTTEDVSKKLPLEPRLLAQRFSNKSSIGPKQISPFPSKQINQPKIKPSKTKQTSNVNEIISLDSDDCDDDATKTGSNNVQESKRTKNNNSSLNTSVSPIVDVSNFILPSLPHITIKKVDRVSSKESIKPPQSAVGSSYLKEALIKLPSNLNIQKVIKTIPKPTTHQLPTNGRVRPRYFVVKKIIKLPQKEMIPNINLSKGMILTKMTQPKKDNTKNDNDDDMPSNDENEEDSAPKSTNGRGILFGVTNSMVIIEFLLKLKSFPELWRSQLKYNSSNNFNEDIKQMCFHLNSRFDLNITDFEMRQSIQRVRNWFCRKLKNINEHNRNLDNTVPYKHKFPLYFRIISQFLRSDVDYVDSSGFKPDTNTHKSIEQKTSLNEKVAEMKSNRKIDISTHFKLPIPAIQYATSTTKTNIITPDVTESLIEFDADTLYDSDTEIPNEFNNEVKSSNQKIVQLNGQRKKRGKFGNFECDMCRKTYKRIYDLKRHKIMHFPPQFECGICSQKFYFKSGAEKCSHLKKTRHRKVFKTSEQDNSGQKRIWPKKIFRFKMICEICGASYRSIGSLNTHKKDKHLNQRAKCVVCNFTALSNWRVVQHQKKRHIVEPGTLQEVAKKTRARTDTKTPFSNEAMQEFLWRREMRKKLKPDEIFHACCKCRIVFNSRQEKVLHNKLEHPIKETTVICLLCLPNKLLLSNSNCARRHYTDIHKVAWHEIDALVKRTKPIFSFLNKEEIELLKASENYKELLEELLKNKQLLEPGLKVEIAGDETLEAVHNLSVLPNLMKDLDEISKIDVECQQEENVYVDCIIDHDYNNENVFKDHEYFSNNEHNYSEEVEPNENYKNDIDNNHQNNDNDLYSHHAYGDDGIVHLDYDIENSANKIYSSDQNDQDYLQSNVDDFIEGELVEESIVVEEVEEEVYF